MGEPDGTPVAVGFMEFIGLVGSIFGFSGFVFSGATVRDVSNAAVDPEGDRELRLHLAKYLEKFTFWFSEAFLVPRIISRLIGDNGCLPALQAVMDDLLERRPALKGDSNEEDVRFWLWDMSVFPAQLRMDRAVLLLRHAGVLRSHESDMHNFLEVASPPQIGVQTISGAVSPCWRRCNSLGV